MAKTTKWLDFNEMNAVTFRALRPGTPTFTLDRNLWLPFPPRQVFTFFTDPMNLAHLTPPDLHFTVVTPPPIEMKQDLLIDYKLKIRGIPLSWRSRISLWDPPVRFVDEQVKGPYLMWIHLHTFEPEGEGTRVGDRVVYAVCGGKLANRFMVAKDVERIFDYRRIRLQQLFNAQ